MLTEVELPKVSIGTSSSSKVVLVLPYSGDRSAWAFERLVSVSAC